MSSESGSESEHRMTTEEAQVPFNIPKNDLRAKYEKLKGKSLMVRFPITMPQGDEFEEFKKSLKLMCERIKDARRQRQRASRTILVDFETPEDRKLGLKELRKVEINGKKLHVEIPKTEKDGYVEKLIQMKEQKLAEKKTKLKLKKAAKKEKQAERKDIVKVFTPTIIVRNIPKDTTVTDIKKLFPDSVDVRLQIPKDEQATATATITLPTPKDATYATKRKLKIGENELKMSYANVNKGKKIENGVTNQLKGKKRSTDTQNQDVPSPKKKKKPNIKPSVKELDTEVAEPDENNEDSELNEDEAVVNSIVKAKGLKKNFNKAGNNRNANKPAPNKNWTKPGFNRNINKPGGYNANRPGFIKNKPGFNPNRPGNNNNVNRPGSNKNFNKTGGFNKNFNKGGFNKNAHNPGFNKGKKFEGNKNNTKKHD